MVMLANNVAQLFGVSTQTLYYYEKEKLIPTIQRDKVNRRNYTQVDIEWIRMVVLMRKIDIPIQEIKKYTLLLDKGSNTLQERYDLICKYKTIIIEKITKMKQALMWLDEKESFYENMILTDCKYDNFIEESSAFKLYLNKNKKVVG